MRYVVPFLFFLLFSCCGKPETGLSHNRLIANGSSVTVLTVPLEKGGKFPSVRVSRGLLKPGFAEKGNGFVRFSFSAGLRAGVERIDVRRSGRTNSYRIRLYHSLEDSDRDGFPDVMELQDERDRRAFREWFCAVAESQFIKPWPRWERAQRDCAGLIRFAYAEALKRHNSRWHSRSGALFRATLPDVRAYAYPDIPLVGLRLFRIRPAAKIFSATNFSSFASVRYLLAYNTRFVSKNTKDASPGDLLFFRQRASASGRLSDAMHAMVLLPGGKLVYHTGDPVKGSVRRLGVKVLGRHPDWRWHPSPANPNFLGVYRFLILEDRTP